MSGIKIRGTGSYSPENIVSNDDFAKIVETSDEWISTRTGIKTRHIADGDTAWSMGKEAALRALKNADMSAEEVDLLLVTTVTPDYYTPSVSCVIQGEIGAVNAACIDLSCACAGFVYAMDMAHRYLSCPDINTVLIVSTERLSGITDYTDRSTCVLFGDGAGACVVQKSEGLFASKIGADGTGAHLMFGRHHRSDSPFSSKAPVENEISKNPCKNGVLYMGGREVYKFATQVMPETIMHCCEKAGMALSDLDWIIPHQANIRIIQTAMKRLGLPMEKAWVNIDHTGNTSSASIPIALDELIQSGKLSRGQKVALTGFGAGLIYAGLVFEY